MKSQTYKKYSLQTLSQKSEVALHVRAVLIEKMKQKKIETKEVEQKMVHLSQNRCQRCATWVSVLREVWTVAPTPIKISTLST